MPRAGAGVGGHRAPLRREAAGAASASVRRAAARAELRDAAVAAKQCAQVRAWFSLLVFGLLAENDCSPGFKAV